MMPLRAAGTAETGMFGWGAWIRTRGWRNQNPLPYHLATPQQGIDERVRDAGGPYRPRAKRSTPTQCSGLRQHGGQTRADGRNRIRAGDGLARLRTHARAQRGVRGERAQRLGPFLLSRRKEAVHPVAHDLAIGADRQCSMVIKDGCHNVICGRQQMITT